MMSLTLQLITTYTVDFSFWKPQCWSKRKNICTLLHPFPVQNHTSSTGKEMDKDVCHLTNLKISIKYVYKRKIVASTTLRENT